MAAQGGRCAAAELGLNVPADVLLSLAGAAAIADWVAIRRETRSAEAVLKPFVAALLVATALVLQPRHPAERLWFVAALALCLAGDVLLLPQVDRFRSGLAAFLLAHLAFIAGFLAAVQEPPVRMLNGAGILPILVIAPAILRGARPKLRLPIAMYMIALFAMFITSWLTGSFAAAAGAGLFMISDTLLALNRFVKPMPGGRVAVMVTYHLAIGLLTLSVAF